MKELTIEQKAKAYDEAIEKAKSKIRNDKDHVLYEDDVIEIFPELAESEDEKMRRWIINYLDNKALNSGIIQEKTNIKNTIAWLEKQGTPAKLSEEEQNRFAKGVLTSCALSFIDYLDAQKYEGKMCVSNGECEDIENAFHNAMWDRLHGYYCKYIEKQGEQKPNPCDGCINRKGCINCENGELRETEQKPADKVEPKFHEGDWVVNNTTLNSSHIVKVEHGQYICDDCSFPITKENEYHLWTIQDAKDGDVLASKGGDDILIFRNIEDNLSFLSYYNIAGKNEYYWAKSSFIPATKEQRDILFQKMKEAGYEWDAEKKKLKKIEQKPAIIDIDKMVNDYANNNEPGNQEFGKPVPCMIRAYRQGINDILRLSLNLEKQHEQNPAWSEEDDELLDEVDYILTCIRNMVYNKELKSENISKLPKDYDILIDRLKSLKDRVQPQPKQEWSEEGTRLLDNCISLIEDIPGTEEEQNWLKPLRPQNKYAYNPYKKVVESIAEMCKHYDKASYSGLRDFYNNVKVKCKDAKEYDSLFPQNRWKPSDEQIKALNYVVNLMASSESPKENDYYYNVFKDLREQLKKLREE